MCTYFPLQTPSHYIAHSQRILHQRGNTVASDSHGPLARHTPRTVHSHDELTIHREDVKADEPVASHSPYPHAAVIINIEALKEWMNIWDSTVVE